MFASVVASTVLPRGEKGKRKEEKGEGAEGIATERLKCPPLIASAV